MQDLDLKTWSYLLCTTIHDLRDYTHYSQFPQCTKYIISVTLTLLISWKYFDIYFSYELQRNLIYSFEAPGTAYKKLKNLTSFNNTTLNNKRVQEPLASWMFRILSPFNFQKNNCAKAIEALSQCLYGCIKYYWVLANRFSISDIASNHIFKKPLTSRMFMESFSFVGAFIIDGFDMNIFTNLKQAWTYLHLTRQCMFVSLKLA